MLLDKFKREYRFRGGGNNNYWLGVILGAIAFLVLWFWLK